MIYKNYNITYASGFILCLYYMPKLYYKYWQKQELLNPYSKHSKFYTSNNLNTYKRQSPSHLSLKNLSNLSEPLIKSVCLYLHIPRYTKTRHKTPLWLHRINNSNPTHEQTHSFRHLQRELHQRYPHYKSRNQIKLL